MCFTFKSFTPAYSIPNFSSNLIVDFIPSFFRSTRWLLATVTALIPAYLLRRKRHIWINLLLIEEGIIWIYEKRDSNLWFNYFFFFMAQRSAAGSKFEYRIYPRIFIRYTGWIKKNRLQKNFTNVNKHFALYERENVQFHRIK